MVQSARDEELDFHLMLLLIRNILKSVSQISVLSFSFSEWIPIPGSRE